MNRTKLSALLFTTALAAGCGTNADPAVDYVIELHVEGDGSIKVDAFLLDERCSDGCTFNTGPASTNTVTLTAEANGESVFAGWSGDCTGTEPTITKIAAEPGMITCTATFDPPGTVTAQPKGGIVVGTSTQCEDPGGGITCFTPGALFPTVLDPTATLRTQMVDSGEHCYFYTGVTEMASEDRGDIALTTSTSSMTATHDGLAYQIDGVTGAPFADVDTLAIDTDDGAFSVDAPGSTLTIVSDGAGGYTITGDPEADGWLWMGLAGFEEASGVICFFAPAATMALIPAEAQAALDEAGFTPTRVYAGPANQTEVAGFDVARAARVIFAYGSMID